MSRPCWWVARLGEAMRIVRSPDRNFGVIELLIVAVIIGVLTQMILTAYLHQRRKGWEAAAQSDLRNGALAQSLFLSDNDRYAASIAELDDEGFRPSLQVDIWVNDGAGKEGIEVEAQHCRGGDRFRWTSGGAHTVERVDRADRKC